MRVQFFPGPKLEAKLNAEAASQGVKVSVLVVDALNKYYGLVGPNTKTEAQLEKEVLDEIAAYIANPDNDVTEFDLNLFIFLMGLCRPNSGLFIKKLKNNSHLFSGDCYLQKNVIQLCNNVV